MTDDHADAVPTGDGAEPADVPTTAAPRLPRPVRVAVVVVLIAVAVVLLFTFVFPWVELRLENPRIGEAAPTMVVSSSAQAG